jgi:hypothetical protein
MTSTVQGVVSSEGSVCINSRSAIQLFVASKCTMMNGNVGDTAGGNRVQSK